MNGVAFSSLVPLVLRPGGGRRRRALSASPPQLTLPSVGRRRDWVRGVGEGMFWLVEPDPSAARQGDLGHPAPARLVEGALERDSFPFQRPGGRLNVVA